MSKKLPRLFLRDTHPELPLDPDAPQPGQYKWPPHFTPQLVLLVFIGGCFGTLARYWIDAELPTAPNHLPISILSINLLGAFLLGFLLEGLVRLGVDEGPSRVVRLTVGTGFMGAFTTYSTLAVGTVMLARNDHMSLAIVYAASSVGMGLIFSSLGIWIAAEHHKRKGSTR